MIVSVHVYEGEVKVEPCHSTGSVMVSFSQSEQSPVNIWVGPELAAKIALEIPRQLKIMAQARADAEAEELARVQPEEVHAELAQEDQDVPF